MRTFTRIKYALNVCALILFLLTAFSQQTFATHMAGGDIEYQNIGPRKWKIKLTVYRYCDYNAAWLCSSFNCPQTITATPSPNINAGGLNPNGCTSNPANISFTVYLESVTDVGKDNIERCGPQSKNSCDNLAQVVPGSYKPSIEKYVFTGILNMDVPSLNPANTCPYWDLGWTYCCRNSTTNVQGQPQFYIQATLNIADGKNNSSPVFLNDAVSVICAGQETVFNMGASDSDRDSLTYEVFKSLQGPNTPVLYNQPFSKDYPFPLIATAPPHSNYPGLPFVVIDTLSGDISLNANNPTTQPIGGQLCVRVAQWRYKENLLNPGTKIPFVVGVTWRDLQLFSIPCLSNSTPRFSTSPASANGSARYNWEVCAGEKICFQVAAKDSDFRPNAIPARIDTTFLSWDHSVIRAPGVITFKPIYDSLTPRPREDAFEFCWQTELSDTSMLPYYFTVKGMDNFCPNPAKVIRAFSIKVGMLLKADLAKQDLGCGKWELKVRKTDVTQSFQTTTLEIANQPDDYNFSGGKKVIHSGNPNPPGSGNGPRAVITDTMQFSQPGKYYLRYSVISTGTACAMTFYDSIQVSFFNPLSVIVRDTFKCKSGAITLSADASGGSGPLQYKWFRNAFSSPVQNSANNQFIVDDSLSVSYHVYVTDTNGCGARDTMQLSVKRINKEEILVNDSGQCFTSNAFTFSHSPITLFSNYTRLWMSEQTTSSDAVWNRSYSSEGSKLVGLAISEPGGCSDTAYRTVHVWPMPSVQSALHVNDSIQCGAGNNFSLTYQLLNNPQHYRNTWITDTITIKDSSTVNLSYPTAGTRLVSLILETVHGCIDTINQQLTVKPSPVQPEIQGPQANILVNDEHDYSVTAQAGNTYQWNVVNGVFLSADTIATVRVKWNVAGEGTLSVKQIFDECEAGDSIKVAVGSTGLTELQGIGNLLILPNPSHGKFTIRMESLLMQKVQVRITNTLGATVLTTTQQLEKGANEISINAELAAGVYLLSISDGNSESARKIVISK